MQFAENYARKGIVRLKEIFTPGTLQVPKTDNQLKELESVHKVIYQSGRSVLTDNSVRLIRLFKTSVFRLQPPIGSPENRKPQNSVSIFPIRFSVLTEITETPENKLTSLHKFKHSRKQAYNPQMVY